MEQGKKTVEAYHDGVLKNKRRTTYSLPVMVRDKSQVLTEVMKSIDLITSHEAHEVSILITADKDYNFKLLTKEYTVVE